MCVHCDIVWVQENGKPEFDKGGIRMKRLTAWFLVVICMLCLAGCSGICNKQTVSFHEKTFNKADLSEETLKWLAWYNELSETEQLAISYIPSDLRELLGYDSVEDVPADTE